MQVFFAASPARPQRSRGRARMLNHFPTDLRRHPGIITPRASYRWSNLWMRARGELSMNLRRLVAVIYALTFFGVSLGLGFTASASWAQLSEAESKAAALSNDYGVTPNIVYLTANGYDDKLD